VPRVFSCQPDPAIPPGRGTRGLQPPAGANYWAVHICADELNLAPQLGAEARAHSERRCAATCSRAEVEACSFLIDHVRGSVGMSRSRRICGLCPGCR
jgi:hypothetical protein